MTGHGEGAGSRAVIECAALKSPSHSKRWDNGRDITVFELIENIVKDLEFMDMYGDEI